MASTVTLGGTYGTEYGASGMRYHTLESLGSEHESGRYPDDWSD